MWLVGGILYIVVERGMLGDVDVYPATQNEYDFERSLVAVMTMAVIGGLVFGLLEEYLFKSLLRRKSFATKLLLKTLLYVAILMVILITITTAYTAIYFDVPIFDPKVLEEQAKFVYNFAFLSIVFYAGVLIAITLFISEMLDHIGLNAVTNFFTGKYSKSQVEDRIFMFLDMKSSTSIAEKLGHKEYYQLLNSYYEDMTDPIIQTAGEIYQYVGDEIVVSWKFQQGVKDNNCLRCFFLIQEVLQKRAAKYDSRFGTIPAFKAGMHCGKITTGEVGLVKKEILFTGDVLNTTSRIQALCNELGTDLLLSKELLANLKIPEGYEEETKGEVELRGKDEKMELLTLRSLER